MTQTYKLIVLRHGQSELNNANMFCGWIDAPLSSKGQDQARSSAQLIKEHNLTPNILYTSKLTRTCQTGKIILEGLQREWLDVKRTWRLNERHYGSFQGRKKNEVLAEYGKEQYMYIRRDYHGKPPDISEEEMAKQILDNRYEFETEVKHDILPRSESLDDVVQRLGKFLDEEIIHNLREYKCSLIVAHGSTVRALIKIIEGLDDEAIKEVNIPNGIPLVIELDHELHFLKKYYLDPELARINAEKVKNEGFH